MSEDTAVLLTLLVLFAIGYRAWLWGCRAVRRTRLRWRRRFATLTFVTQVAYFASVTASSLDPAHHADWVGEALGRYLGLPPGPARAAVSMLATLLVTTLAGVLLGWPLDRRRSR